MLRTFSAGSPNLSATMSMMRMLAWCSSSQSTYSTTAQVTDIIISTEETASMYDWPTVRDVRVEIFKLLESLNLRLSVFESLNL